MSAQLPPGPLDRLAAALNDAGVDAYVAQEVNSLGYLAGFPEDAHERFMALMVSARGDVTLIAPALSEAQARRAGIEHVQPWADGEDPLALFAQVADAWQLRSGILAVDPGLPARQLLAMQNTLPAALFRDGESLLGGLRRVKAETELQAMREAARIADAAYEDVLPRLRAGQTEREVEAMVKDAMAARGGRPTFCIIAAGPNAAEPHHLTDDTVIQPGDVLLLDFGCSVRGYQSDITRVCAIESASPKATEIYGIVREAHLAGLSAIRPGAPAMAVDAACRGVITAAGHGPAFFHRTGHGIGLDGHEHPYITATNDEPLEVGNCFSVEPGIYYRGEFGVRLETIVAVTEDGYENLNAPIAPELQVVG